MLKSAISSPLGYATEGEQIVVTTNIKNCSQEVLPFVTFIELRNADGITEHIGWQSGTIEGNKIVEVGIPWVPRLAGSFELRTFVVSDLTRPVILSPVAGSNITIAESDRAAAEGSPDNDNRPNIIVVMTDDQRWDTVQYMPNVVNLASKGITFSNSFATTALCCPSRASFLTGLYAHNHGVWTNEPPLGGVTAFDDSSTLATSLHDSGYRTALIGKYLNGYRIVSPYIPPGWDEWRVLVPTEYFNYNLNENGQENFYGNSEADYSTDILRDKAIDFIQSSGGDGQPFFLLFTPYASHGPTTPAPRHDGSCNDIAIKGLPSFNESDVSDKPPWIANIPPFDDARVHSIDQHNRAQICTLKAVDEAVGAIIDALGSEIDNTVIIFTTDNGFLWGEHRLQNKNQVYEEAIRVPLIVHSPKLLSASAPLTINQLVANIDLAPTIAELANVTLETQVDGMSLLPLINDQSIPWRDKFLIEQASEDGSPIVKASAVRTSQYKYVEYYDDDDVTNAILARELYDLLNDPFELTNVIDDSQYSQIREELADSLIGLKSQ